MALAPRPSGSAASPPGVVATARAVTPKNQASTPPTQRRLATVLLLHNLGKVTVVSPHLVAVDAAWDDGPYAGGCISDRLGPFGASVGHAVPLGYPAYAVVPIPPYDDLQSRCGCLPVIEA
jgi:hypothetical protein